MRLVMRFRLLPSGFIVYSSMSPSMVLVKISFFPSCETVVSALYAPLFVSWRRSEPSSFEV